MGDHGMYQKRKPYEPAIRVPLMISGPGIAGGGVSSALIELIDLNPTICSLAGIPPQENIDAQSFESILSGKSENHRENIVTAVDNFRCIRTRKFKYVASYNDISELYDLEKDPLELNNIADEKPEIAQELGQKLLERFMEGGIQR
jgi:choline-sulfatase